MKIISKILIIFIICLSSFNLNTNAWFFDDLFDDAQPKIDIWVDCWWVWEETCINEWISIIKNDINSIEKDRTLSEYIQDVVVYILTFLSIIAVLYIIYAWFRILTWAWDEEVLKKQKSTILYVIVWMLLIWLAYPITLFIFDVLNSAPSP